MLSKQDIAIFRTKDKYGPIRVLENSYERYLIFGSLAKQSAVLKNNFKISTLKYQQVMQLVSLFKITLKKILIIGHGGGAMANFFQDNFLYSQIEVWEKRVEVYKVAKFFFGFQEKKIHYYL